MEKLLPLASARLVTTVNVTGALEDNPISMYTKREKYMVFKSEWHYLMKPNRVKPFLTLE